MPLRTLGKARLFSASSTASQWFEIQVIKQVEDCMTEEQADLLFADLRSVCIHQFGHLYERTKKDQQETLNLPLVSLNTMRVKVATLKVREPELGRGRRVAVGCAQCNLHAKVVDAGPSFCAAVV